jgi:DNA polymerase I
MGINRLFLIDGHSLIYRAYFAIRSLSTSKGFPTNAVYGFTNMLLKVIREKKPDYLVVALDAKGPTHRHMEYEAYKAQRPEMPDGLQLQLPIIHRLVSAFQIPILIKEGYEADDLIGTLAKRSEQQGLDVTIVTSDKDMFQLITPRIRIYDTMKDKTYEERDVRERFGVEPARVIEIMGLMGDAIDNIPGVPGIGEKTAIKLIGEFETIDNLLKNLDRINKPKLRKTLQEHSDQAHLSRQLAALQLDCPIEVDFTNLKAKPPDLTELTNLFRELEFTSLIKKVKESLSLDVSPKEQSSPSLSLLPASRIIINKEGLISLTQRVEEARQMVIEPLPVSRLRKSWIGVSVSLPDESYYIPIGHQHADVPSQLDENVILKQLSGPLKNSSVKKLGHDLKTLLISSWNRELSVEGPLFDTSIASYLFNSNQHDHSLETSAFEHLGYSLSPIPTDVQAPGASAETVAATMNERGQCILKLSNKLLPLLAEQQLTELFQEIELPLIAVLADMERTGIKLNVEKLATLSKELDQQLGAIMQRIYSLAGDEFNINSPKQLSEILFKKLGLKPIKRTKTGYSTNEEVLQQLTLEHNLPAEILNYRQLAKLKSTYVDALPRLVNPETGRVHTSFNQTATATGRLSSSEPNLQNIPIKGEWGKRIRKCFIAEDGCQLMSFDYNQIELRILAHLSGDEKLIKDFIEDKDIHMSTAMKIFGLPGKDITPEMRRTAKTVNFGIIYGISAYGLSTTLGIPQTEAKRYIENYLSQYQGVRLFMKQTIEEASARGFVTTMMLRRRAIPELASQERAIRAFGERTAVNTVIQGSAADLIKLAMIQIYKRIRKEGLMSHMLLQIHDELLFEVPVSEIKLMKFMVKKEMEGVIALSVPLKVDVGMAADWAKAHP